MDYRGMRVTVMGLGRFGGGLAAARFLAQRGARVTVTDAARADSLADSLARLRELPIEGARFGGHAAEDFDGAEMIVVNPAVRPGHPLVEQARVRGARIVGEVEIFFDHCPARIIAVTGSNGKSTTAAMTASIVQAAGRRVWLGGNIGASLLERVDQLAAEDWVVLELSSFQLWWLRHGITMPQVAVVTNFSPNHLDWHGTIEEYAAAKQRLIGGQRTDDVAVLNLDDPSLAAWASTAAGGVRGPKADAAIGRLLVPGAHNRQNARLAAAVGSAIGCSDAAIARGLGDFRGLEMRWERIGNIAGHPCYNDSSATTPESTLAALDALPNGAWFIVGGRDKGCETSTLIASLAKHARGVAFIGGVAPLLAAQLAGFRSASDSCVAESLDAALAWCLARALPGEAIVLSPGFASDAPFVNFQQRGNHFNRLVRALARQHSS